MRLVNGLLVPWAGSICLYDDGLRHHDKGNRNEEKQDFHCSTLHVGHVRFMVVLPLYRVLLLPRRSLRQACSGSTGQTVRQAGACCISLFFRAEFTSRVPRFECRHAALDAGGELAVAFCAGHFLVIQHALMAAHLGLFAEYDIDHVFVLEQAVFLIVIVSAYQHRQYKNVFHIAVSCVQGSGWEFW